MKKTEYLLKSFASAAGVLIYVSVISWMLFNAENIFGDSPSFVIPLFMLLLFIVSATTTGLLVLGKPIHMYMNGLKKEAIALLSATLVWLVVFIAAIIVVLVIR